MNEITSWISLGLTILALVVGFVAAYFFQRMSDQNAIAERFDKFSKFVDDKFIPRTEVNLLIQGLQNQLENFETRMENHHRENREDVRKSNSKLDTVLKILSEKIK